MLAARDRAAHVVGAVLLDHGRRAVVHADDHRGRPALARESLDHARSLGEAQALTADAGRADEPEQAARREGFYVLGRKRRNTIDLDGVGRDDGGDGL